jgi:hypothetical protein
VRTTLQKNYTPLRACFHWRVEEEHDEGAGVLLQRHPHDRAPDFHT